MIGYFSRHPTAANLLMIVFLVVGVMSVPQLRRETFPDITPAEVEIRVVYPGATAEEVEEIICRRVEDAVDGVKFIEEIRADAREGIAIVVVEMEDGGEFLSFKDDITTEVDAIDDFPDDVEAPVITQLGTTDIAVEFLVSAETSPSRLKLHCEGLKDRLKKLSEISLVNIGGFSDHQFRIELSSEALKRFGFSVNDVADILSRQNVSGPSGSIETQQQNILLRFVEERRTPTELEDLIVKSKQGGAEIRLGEIGKVVDVFEVDEDKILLRTQRAGLVRVSKTKNQDIIRVASAVKDFIEKERERYPHVNIEIVRDDSTLVKDRLKMLVTNSWQGMLLVFLTLWLFFNLKFSFWVAMSLPVSFLGAFYFMPWLGLTINMMTMVGMLLALGLLMDDGIVIAENIAVHRALGKTGIQAAVDGVNEVKSGVISSFLTTVCVLGPLATISGDIGKVLMVIPIMLITVMTVSLIEAFAILPAHLGHSLSHTDRDKKGKFRTLFDAKIEWVREALFGRAVDFLIRWRYLWLGTVVSMFLVVVGLFVGGIVRFQAFPDIEGDTLLARVQLPAGTPLPRTEKTVDEIVEALERVNRQFTPRQPGEQELVKTVSVEFNKNTDAFENGPHVATVTIKLLPAEIRRAFMDDIIAAWKKEIGELADVQNLSIAEPSFGPAGRPIEVRLQGENLAQLEQGARELENWIAQYKGTRNLSYDLRLGKPEIRIALRPGALGYGLDARKLALQLRSAFSGVIADQIQVESESYEIDVRLNSSEYNSIADLEYFQFTLPNGDRVPLNAVVELDRQRSWSRIARVNGIRTVTLRGDLDSRDLKAASLANEFKNNFLPEFQKKYPEVSVSIEGEVKEGNHTAGSMIRAMGLGLIGVFILLSFQFRSYYEPLVVMVAIPLALIGVIVGHLVLNIDFSMPSLLGFFSLSGVVVNDSILLVLFLKSGIDNGQDVLTAASQASRQRFRAIMLTSLTTIAGLTPLLFERSLQAQVIIPLAVSIAFGLLASTVLVLLVLPCIYLILADFGFIKSRNTTVTNSETTGDERAT